ncbi:hypothetical protein HYH03_010240 [Edaphochlamys debaryana]|uniref:Right handed beta helix domain-containing protein n=1 Tax=Edaphochlamys debaryana TaxID=47281 RepID=A0A836BXQ9_9CHLO|nr:hypothetical protein HYH03_010240 [Edaphochlamys debaryana]|eukprot:KAG2491454.1 hypothetical protein HYH03_010240 [Edaphochlamys debaryana]
MDVLSKLDTASTGTAAVYPDETGMFGAIQLKDAADVAITRFSVSRFDYSVDPFALSIVNCARCALSNVSVTAIVLRNSLASAVFVNSCDGLTITNLTISNMGGWNEAESFSASGTFLSTLNANVALSDGLVERTTVDGAASLSVSGGSVSVSNVVWRRLSSSESTPDFPRGRVIQASDNASLSLQACVLDDVQARTGQALIHSASGASIVVAAGTQILPATPAAGGTAGEAVLAEAQGSSVSLQDLAVSAPLALAARFGAHLSLQRLAFTGIRNLTQPLVALSLMATASIEDCKFEQVGVAEPAGFVPDLTVVLSATASSAAVVSGCSFTAVTGAANTPSQVLLADGGSSLSVSRCRFAELGGWAAAVRADGRSALLLEYTQLRDINIAAPEGAEARGLVVIEGGSVLNATQTAWMRVQVDSGVGAAAGAALTATAAGDITLDNCVFSDVTTPQANVVSLSFIDASSTVLVDSCRWSNVTSLSALALQNVSGPAAVRNSAFSGCRLGGAVRASSCGRVAVEGCSFARNQAPLGGAIAAEWSAVQVSDSAFDSNTALDRGGAVLAMSRSALALRNCSFDGNTAGASGGAVFFSEGSLDASGVAFRRNLAVGTGDAIGMGGAISCVDGTGQVTASAFSQNRAIGAPELADISAFDCTIDTGNSTFEPAPPAEEPPMSAPPGEDPPEPPSELPAVSPSPGTDAPPAPRAPLEGAATECEVVLRASPEDRSRVVPPVVLSCWGEPVTLSVGFDYLAHVDPGSTGSAVLVSDEVTFAGLTVQSAANVTFTRVILENYDYPIESAALTLLNCAHCKVRGLQVNDIWLRQPGSAVVQVANSADVEISDFVATNLGGWVESQSFSASGTFLTAVNSANVTLLRGTLQRTTVDGAASLDVSGGSVTLSDVSWSGLEASDSTPDYPRGRVVQASDGANVTLTSCILDMVQARPFQALVHAASGASVALTTGTTIRPALPSADGDGASGEVLLAEALGSSVSLKHATINEPMVFAARFGAALAVRNVAFSGIAGLQQPLLQLAGAAAVVEACTFGEISAAQGDAGGGGGGASALVLSATQGSVANVSACAFSGLGWPVDMDRQVLSADGNTTLVVHKCVFSELGGTGKAIRASGGSQLTLDQTSFNDIDASASASADPETGGQARAIVHVDGSRLVAMSSAWGRIDLGDAENGAAVLASGGSVSFDACSFNAIDAPQGYGVWVTDPTGDDVAVNVAYTTWREVRSQRALRIEAAGAPVVVRSNSFTDCSSGGALQVSNSPAVTLAGSAFQSNSAGSGAAVATEACNMTVTDSFFSANQAEERGGAILATGSGALTLVNCSFEANLAAATSGISGGAVYVEDVALRATNGMFVGNTANAAGGAIGCYEGSVTVEGSTFGGNAATGAAGTNDIGQYECKLDIRNSSTDGGYPPPQAGASQPPPGHPRPPATAGHAGPPPPGYPGTAPPPLSPAAPPSPPALLPSPSPEPEPEPRPAPKRKPRHSPPGSRKQPPPSVRLVRRRVPPGKWHRQPAARQGF